MKTNTVEIEKRLTATTADIFYIENAAMFPVRIAVECKDWATPLSSRSLSDIFSLYKSSIVANEIDKLLIISRHELGQQPSETVDRMSDTVYMQYDVFVHNLMDFQLLLQNNVAAFQNHEASKNFIQPRCRNTANKLSDKVYAWLENSNSPVSMVYGGYGLGKTSFSHYLAAELSKKYRNNAFDRIPIRIPLGGLFTKQDLQALICSELTGAEGSPAVGKFAYDIFLHMVRHGSIFLILDGFDEMKHAMSIEDFEFTFEQMSPLFEGKSKVTILGRPDAFFDAEEEERIITSLLASTGLENETVTTLEVAQFSKEEIDQYLAHFCKDKNLSTIEINFIGSLKEREYEILARPVQINMFTKIVNSLSNSTYAELTRYRLYQEFVKRFVRREIGKKARKTSSQDQKMKIGYNDPRSKFMQNIAWWILTNHRENRFLPNDIPYEVLPKELKVRGSDLASIREALIGSIVEHSDNGDAESGLIGKKGANYFYFPHKSYMEFLVSQYFCRVAFTKEMYREFFVYANPEMISFVREGPNEGAQNIAQGLEYVLGNVPRELIKIASGSANFQVDISDERIGKLNNPRKYLTYEHLLSKGGLSDIEKFLLRITSVARTNKTISAMFILNGDYISQRNSKNFIGRLIAMALINLPDVILEEILLGSRRENYTDNNFVYSIILCRCLIIDPDGIWYFKPSTLLTYGVKLAANSMHCSEYGKSEEKKVFERIQIYTDDIKELITADGAKKQKLIKDFFDLKSIPSLRLDGRAGELIH